MAVDSSDRQPEGERLDSWKAIAVYLNRGERTVRRWEMELGLPIRRLPGKRGASVFAYTGEIDTWLNRTRPPLDPGEASPAVETEPEGSASAPEISSNDDRGTPSVAVRGFRWPLYVAALTAVVAAAVLAVWPRAASASDARIVGSAVIGVDSAGVEVWRRVFPGERLEPLARNSGGELVGRESPTLVTASALRVEAADEAIAGGQLLAFTPRGVLTRSFMFDDRPVFHAGSFQPPWVISDFRGGPSSQIALAAHHYQWWPSVVTVLDRAWQRRFTFVNAGWVEHVRWLSADRLLVSGFFQPLDGGMVALLDPTGGNAQSPADPASAFACDACGRASALEYVVIPRSEVNRATNARFNRARMEWDHDHLFVHTIEASPSPADVADAVYEFTPSLGLLSAAYSDRYWDIHRDLEQRGVLKHAREQCPERDGPASVRVWTPASGWRTVAIPHRATAR